MSAFESIKRGLTEAIVHSKGVGAGVFEYHPSVVDIAALRQRLALG